jgi:hypothetical protein
MTRSSRRLVSGSRRSFVAQERAGGLSVPELVTLLEHEALDGSVQAMKYLLERPWERKNDEEVKPEPKTSIFDELQALRDRKTAT